MKVRKSLRLGMVVATLLLLPAIGYAEPLLCQTVDEGSAVRDASVLNITNLPERELLTAAADPPKDETPKEMEAPKEAEPSAEEAAEEVTIADPIEPWNRIMFTVNDRVYFWLMKPASKVYNAVLPEQVRVSINNFFHNITTPVRFVNCLLQLKLKCAGNELVRLGINSTVGFGGFFDIAKSGYGIEGSEKDLGLTFGYYGIGNGFYIIWPFLGPSSLRDSIGMVGDGFLNPLDYVTPTLDSFALQAYQYFNNASLHVGEYEDFKKASIEPYTAMRDAYVQHRNTAIRE